MKKIWICLLLMLFLVGCRDLPDEQASISKTTEPANAAAEKNEFPKESFELKPIDDPSVIDEPVPVTPPMEVEENPDETATQNR